VPEPARNIFAFYEKPVALPTPVVTPTSTPTPTPPVLLAAISPPNVYAKTADFTLEVTGDKFTPEMRIFVDGRELATKYKGPQQMSAPMTAAMIAVPGLRQVGVRTPEIVFIDTNLKIKHTLSMTEGERTAGAPSSRPTPRVDAEDDEP
jgi:hypothetical protein